MTTDEGTGLDRAIGVVLADVARASGTILYRDLARRAGVPGPQAIHKTTMALESLIQRDHAAGRPLLAAAAIGKTGIPRPGFFHLVRGLGLYDGPDEGPEAEAWHRDMLAQLHDRWARTPGEGAP